MQITRLVEYSASGAVAGAAFTGLGATVLALGNDKAFPREGAALAGVVGGAVTHAAYGLLAAFDHEPGALAAVRKLGHSLPLAALTSGLLGGAILSLSGYHDVPAPGPMVAAGIVGGLILATAAGAATVGSLLCCTKRPAWAVIGSGDLEQGEHLLSGDSAP